MQKRLMNSPWYLPLENPLPGQVEKTTGKLKGHRLKCSICTLPVGLFDHAQCSTKWHPQGQKNRLSLVRLCHQRIACWRAPSLGRESETYGNSLSDVSSVWTLHHESTKGLRLGRKAKSRENKCHWWRLFWLPINITRAHREGGCIK